MKKPTADSRRRSRKYLSEEKEGFGLQASGSENRRRVIASSGPRLGVGVIDERNTFNLVGPDPRSGLSGRSGNGPYIFRPWVELFLRRNEETKQSHPSISDEDRHASQGSARDDFFSQPASRILTGRCSNSSLRMNSIAFLKMASPIPSSGRSSLVQRGWFV